MKKILVFSIFVCIYTAYAANLGGPLVYVVTPSSKSSSANEGRSAPFYYHNWMRRMDTPQNNITTTSTTPKVKTPDLIFAEFESGNDMSKSIRKLLDREKIQPTTTTSRPIYVPSEEQPNNIQDMLPIVVKPQNNEDLHDMNDYYNLYNNNNLYSNVPAPVNTPSITQSTTKLTTEIPTTTAAPMNVENIWHIIDNEKRDQYSGSWNEVPIHSENENTEGMSLKDEKDMNKMEHNEMDEHFALPGFGTNPGNGAENESRAIRTEPNMRFPYVSLKPFQMKKPLLNAFSSSKKGNNMLTSLDNFHEVQNPVRGEAQDVIHMRQPVDRYNPAQAYLPSFASKSKQSNPSPPKPSQAVASLVPPPPPPPPPPPSPQATYNDFSISNNYESFPPYPPSIANPSPALPPPSRPPPISAYQPPQPPADDSDSYSSDDSSDSSQMSDDGPTMDLGYRYKPPSPPQFVPTIPPVSKPFNGYSYDKPMMAVESPPAMNTGVYSYSKPVKTFDTPPPMNDDMSYSYSKPKPTADDKPDFHGYHYDKPPPPPANDYPPSHDNPPDHPPSHSYGHHGPPTDNSDYPELIFNKPDGGMNGQKESDDAKDMGMMPPPPPADDMKPSADVGPPMDSGFPHDFPGDFKYHDTDDHDFHHYHHHHTTTTTTTTTEMPRVNRYSYYYLGKKLYYLPLYFSVYFIVYVGALIIKAVLRHKIVYPNSWRPNDQTASFFSKRSIDSLDLSNENLHEMTGRVTKAIGEAAEKYIEGKQKRK